MIRVDIQFFGGRGSKSGANKQSTLMTFTGYDTEEESKDGLGFGNGGETDRWMNSLSEEEKKAVFNYTLPSNYYRDLNDELRANGVTTSQAELDKNLEKALNEFNLEKPTTFIRGSTPDLLGGARTVDEINKMVGNIVVDRGYTSSSAHKGGGFSGEDIIYHIDAPAGKGVGAYIRGLSDLPGENEFLFNKGGMYRIKRAYEAPAKYGKPSVHVDIEWIGREKK